MSPTNEPFAPPLKKMQLQGEPVVTANPTPGAGLVLPNSGTLPIRIMPDLSSTYLTPAAGDALFLTPTEATAAYSSLSHTHTVVQITTTTASLSSVTSSLAMIRVGSSPYDFVSLTYDSTYAKWVAPSGVIAEFYPSAAAFTTTSITYVQVQPTFSETYYPYRAFDTAGLKPQFRIMGRMKTSNATYTASLAPQFFVADAGAALSGPTGPSWAATTVSTSGSGVIVDSSWQDLPSVTLSDYLIPLAYAKIANVAATNTVYGYQIHVRWVSK